MYNIVRVKHQQFHMHKTLRTTFEILMLRFKTLEMQVTLGTAAKMMNHQEIINST